MIWSRLIDRGKSLNPFRRPDAKDIPALQARIKEQADKLEGKGELDGLHNLVKQNVALAEITEDLIHATDRLSNTTAGLNVVLIVLAVIGIFLSVYLAKC